MYTTSVTEGAMACLPACPILSQLSPKYVTWAVVALRCVALV